MQLARDRSLPHLPHRKSCGNEKLSLSQLSRVVICHVVGTLKQVRDCVRNIQLPLLIGPQFSSDPSADGPDKKGEDKLPIHEETNSSDTKSDLPESRPSTPTKPRGMSKRKYKNLVRKHRKQYPRVSMQTSSTVHKESHPSTREINIEIKPKKRSKTQRNIEKAALMLKRRLAGSKARREEMKSQKKRRKEKGPQGRREEMQSQKKRREEKGREDRGKDVVSQKKRRTEKSYRDSENKAQNLRRSERKRRNPDYRASEYRQRKMARRKEQQQSVHEPYDFWHANELPTDDQLRNFEKDPGTAVAMFRLMAGVPKNHLRRPENLSPSVDTQGIIKRFASHAGHNASIKICSICSVRSVMVGDESKELPLEHKYIQLVKLHDENPLSDTPRSRTRRIVTVDGEHYRLDPDGFDENTKLVTVCATCEKALFYASSTKRLPRQSLAFYDPGIIPARLPKLSLIEILAISKNLVYTAVFHMRAIGGVQQIGLKGHSYVLPIDTVESVATLVSSLPREDLTKHIMVGFMGTRSVYKVVKEMAKRLRPLSLNPKHVFMWLHFLKQVENPYYVNINIPDTEEKRGIAARKLLGDVAEVYDAGDVCGSATVLQLAKAQRSELEDSNSGVDDEQVCDDVRMDTVLISQVHTVRNPIELAFESLHTALQSQSEGTDEKKFAADEYHGSKTNAPAEAANKAKHLIRVRSELLCDYGQNPELISGAFPCLFPLGLTAEDAGGTGLLSKAQVRTLLLSNDRRFAEDKTFLL